MDLVKAERIFYGVGGKAGMRRDEIDGDLFLDLRDALSRRLREGWEFARWPDLTRWEKRYFRKVWSVSVSAQVTAGSEWYHPDSEDYYVALKATTNAPAEDGEVHADWAVLESTQTADDWDETLSYDAGDKVFYPVTEEFYQCHTATSAGDLPTDTTKWGVVPDFSRYVALEQLLAGGATATEIGTVFQATERNPKAVGRSARAIGLTHWRSDAGIQIDEDVPWAWLEFRIRPPVLDGNLWVVSTAYGAGECVYYSVAEPANAAERAASGDFYECVTAAAANESPATHPAKWSKREIPLFLERYLVTAVYADYLEMEGQKEKAEAEMGLALGELGRLRMVEEGYVEERAMVGAR